MNATAIAVTRGVLMMIRAGIAEDEITKLVADVPQTSDPDVIDDYFEMASAAAIAKLRATQAP